MSMTDPISDFLARIRNAIMARHQEVVAPASKLKQRIAELLVSEGYIAGIDVRDEEGMPNIVRAPASACTSVMGRFRRFAPGSGSPSCPPREV
jgi:ribosomal protein S8